MSSPPPLPRRPHSAGYDASLSRDPQRGSPSSASQSNKGLLVGLAVALIALLLILALLILAAGIGFGFGLVPSPWSKGNGTQSNPVETKNAGVADDDNSAPKPSPINTNEKDSPKSQGTVPQKESRPVKTADSPENKNEVPPKKDVSEPEEKKESPASDKVDPPPSNKGSTDSSGTEGLSSGSGGSGKENEFSIAGGSFFGLKAEKGSIVYVVDCSSSMAGEPFERARNEILRSVKALSRNQMYFVILFSDTSFPMYFPDEQSKMLLATPANFQKLENWLSKFSGSGGTDPSDALTQALNLHPKTIFFLTDGGFDSGVVNTLRSSNRKRITINTIAFVTRGGEPLLKTIAKENKGTYTFVP